MTEPIPPRRHAPDGLAIRAARPEDAPALAGLYAWPGVRHGTAQLPFPDAEAIRRRLERNTGGGRDRATELVATLDGATVGNATLGQPGGRRAHLGRLALAVGDPWAGRGIGTALLTALVDLADRWLALRRLELTVVTDNVPAIALYRRSGFAIEGTHRGFLLRDGVLVDGHSMARLRDAPPFADGVSDPSAR